MSSRHCSRTVLLALTAVLLGLSAKAADLTFDQARPLVDGVAVDPAYGDRIDAMVQGSFHYGGTRGLTTHVTVSYGPAGAAPALWGTGYGSLSAVLYKGNESAPALEVTLTADPGWTVVLDGFELAAFAADFSSFPVVVSRVSVLDATGAPVFESVNQAVSETAATGIFFSAPIEDVSLTIRLDLTNLLSSPGGSRGGLNASDAIGIDNVRFGERGGAPLADGKRIAVTNGPAWIALGDLDGDGDGDMLIASPSEITWSENLGAESGFGLQHAVHTGAGATGIAAADLDRDGDLDAVVSWGTGGEVAWYENLGGGDFGDPSANGRSIGNVSGASSVAVADIDRDGDLDLLATGSTGGTADWFENDGTPADGGWTVHAITALAGGARHAAVADLDQDGDLDVLVASEAGPVFSWYENLGGGDFGSPVANQRLIVNAASGGRWIGAADLDGDGQIDALTASCDDDTVAWYPNALRSPAADFGPARVISAAAGCPEAVIGADIDLDGDLDVVVASADGSAAWFRNLGAGSFGEGTPLPGSDPGGTDIAAGDLDRDGDPDVVQAAAGGVAWFDNRLNHRSVMYPLRKQVNLLNGLYTELALADVDRDGDADLIAAERTSPGGSTFEVKVLRNTGTGSFPMLSSFLVSNLTRLVTADLDGDGDADLIAAHDGISWFANLDAAGGFTGPAQTIAAGGASDLYRSLAVADLDADGDLDVVAGGDTGTAALLSWYENDGTPADGGWTAHPLTVPLQRVMDVAVDDLDRDGSPDIAATAGSGFGFFGGDGCSSCSVVWFRGNAASHPAQFTMQPQIYTLPGLNALAVLPGGRPFSLASVLGPADADPDLAVGIDSQLSVFENRLDEPSSDFVESHTYGTASGGYGTAPEGSTTSLLVEDLNADGRSDVVVTDANTNATAFPLFARNFTSNFNFPIFSAPEAPRRAAAADLDGDGDLDLVTTDEGGDAIFTHLPPGVTAGPNRGGQYGLSVTYPGESDLFATEGDVKSLLRFTLSLRAAVGDPSARLESLALRLVDSSNVPLTTAQANAIIDRLHVYRSAAFAGNPTFSAATDIRLATVEDLDLDSTGTMGVAIPPGDSNLLVAGQASFFVVAEIAADAASGPVRQWKAAYVADSVVLRSGIGDSHLSAEEPLPALGAAPTLFVSPRIDSFVDAADLVPGDLSCDTGGGACTLRAAIQEANARPGRDEVRLAPGTYTLELPGEGEDAALTGDLDVTSGPLTIIGAGADRTIIDGGGLDRVFDIRGGSVELRDLTIRNGRVTATDVLEGSGGAVRSFGGSLTVRNCVIEDSEAYVGGGVGNLGTTFHVIDSRIVGNVATARGGGLHNQASGSSIVLQTSTVAANTAADGGGVANDVDAAMTIYLSTISGNHAVPSADGAGDGGGVWNRGVVSVTNSTIAFNSAATVGGLSAGTVQNRLQQSLLAGNQASAPGADCGGTFDSFSDWNLVQDSAGCADLAGEPSNRLGIDPLLGPLQDNGGPTPTHALLPGSPAIDAGYGCGINWIPQQADQRGVTRVDLPSVPNYVVPSTLVPSDGCDIGAYEVSLVSTLPAIDVPVRWCVVEGSPSFDLESSSLNADVNALLQERLSHASEDIWNPQSAIRFRSGATAAIPDFPILPDPNTSIGEPGDVLVDPPARDYSEFLQLIADCRTAWEQRDPTVVGVTAVNINRFVDPSGNPIDLLGLGGRADFGSRVQQLDAGRVMVVDQVYRRAPYANPEDLVERVLAHELGHAAGSLRHGDGIDNPGPYPQCGNGIIDDDDDRCVELPRFDGGNLMQYRTGTALTNGQVNVAREHIGLTIPDSQAEVTAAGSADAGGIDGEFLNVLDWEFLNVLDFEFLNVLDWEFLNVLDFEFLNVLDFEEKEVLDFEFLNVLDFGMDFSITDASTGDGETTLYATVAGLPWPTPIRPPASYFWYLDLDEDPSMPHSGDGTGAQPADYGFPAGEAGTDVIVMVELYSTCDALTSVCSDFVVETAFAFAGSAGYQVRLGPVAALDAVEPVTVGLVQVGTDVEREDQTLEVILAPRLPNDLLIDAVPGYYPGGPVGIQVISAIPCGATLPNGDMVDCQCTDCSVCPEFPGCETTGVPEAFKFCTDGVTACRTDAECASGQACGGGKTCHDGGGTCVSNDDCTAGDFCGGAALQPADQPAAAITFEPPSFPHCVADPSPTTVRAVTVVAGSFPTGTGNPMTVHLGDQLIHTETSPVFDPQTGEARLSVLLPADSPYGEALLTVGLQGFATTATCPISIALAPGGPTVVEAVSAPIDPQQAGTPVVASALFSDDPGDSHTATWDWGDGTTTDGTVVEPSGADPGTVTGSHSYTQPGTYVVHLSITDGQGNVTEQQIQFIVVYDPAAGFVTGGGHIDSPPGAYAAQPTLVGKAQFGFVARYQNDGTAPEGNINFDLKVAGLQLKSTDLEWLVVTGPKAQVKGRGEINGAGNYGFLVTVIDEVLTGATNMDGFRIRIWDRDQGDTVIYDNRLGQDDYGAAVTDISAGSIVIHVN